MPTKTLRRVLFEDWPMNNFASPLAGVGAALLEPLFLFQA
jgi:hypothetical protein